MPSRPGLTDVTLSFCYRPTHGGDEPAFVAGLPSALAYNTQDVINFSVTGNIVAGSCNVSYPATVELGTYLPTDFINEGDSTDNVPFTVSFTNCSPSLTKATVALPVP